MNVERRERPKCRKEIEQLLRDKNCTLQDLVTEENRYKIGDGMRIQANKMIDEEAAKTVSR